MRAELEEWDKVSARAKSRQDSEPIPVKFERILDGRREIGPKQRAYLGEIKDPAENIYQTLAKSSRLQSAMQGDLNLLRYLKENPNAVHKGAIVNPKDPHLMPSDFEPISLQTKGLGENVYVHRDVNTALKGFYYNNDKVQHKNPMLGGMADMWGTALGSSKAVKTIFNPASYAPQFTGGLTATVANGVFPSLAFGRDMGLGFRMALKDFFSIDNLSAKRQTPKQRKNFLDMIQRASELNLLPSSIVASDLRDTLNRGGDVRVGAKEDRAVLQSLQRGRQGDAHRQLDGGHAANEEGLPRRDTGGDRGNRGPYGQRHFSELRLSVEFSEGRK